MTVYAPRHLISGWIIKPTKHIFSVQNGATPSSSEQSYWDGDIFWATPEDIGALEAKTILNTRRKITQEGYSNSGTKLAPIGSIILTTRAPVGNLALAGVQLCTNQGCKTLVQKSHNINTNYFYYQFLARKEELSQLATGTTFQELGADDLRDFELWLPPYFEQCMIANYLDSEIAKIDTLISARERLLDLLTEKRRALITHAVTRGLNPDVSLQNSSFEFFKYIPEHWEVINLKFLGDVRTGVTKGRNFGNRETVLVPYFRVANVQDGYLDLSDIAQIEVLPEEISSFKLEKGDVLMNEGGDADKLGRGAVWDGSIDPCLHQNHVFAVRCHNIEPDWLTTVIGSHYAKAYFESRSKQSTNLASISTTNIKELPIVVPPPEERKAIIEYLKEATSKLERLCSVATSTIELLHERRTALITAAVTGQIKMTG
ncbi:MAG: restriction endonuclease subunit S [Nostoc sp. DedQUE08]|uniref:restriction endonuclease subunit S n=1 Tax=Nostoc sp. DedQUE08 TaxID=3075393 RepID=UPI002AD40733|nr:restriction endonuclease subunit S [Nostoc sp. DedQUE08]MDZ8069730.1 restriction endonuclease subunit S [Nostoc sp. DedQUE08]